MHTPLDRAKSLVGRLRYVLGAGGRDPAAPHPGDLTGACDCSGFIAWCLGIDRKQDGFAGYGWVSTDSLVAMSRLPDNGWLVEVVKPEPGDLIVYPSIYKGGQRIRVGHVGLVTEAPVPWAGFTALRVIHCSAGNQRRTKKAVQETNGAAWQGKGTIYLRWLKTAPTPA